MGLSSLRLVGFSCEGPPICSPLPLRGSAATGSPFCSLPALLLQRFALFLPSLSDGRAEPLQRAAQSPAAGLFEAAVGSIRLLGPECLQGRNMLHTFVAQGETSSLLTAAHIIQT